MSDESLSLGDIVTVSEIFLNDEVIEPDQLHVGSLTELLANGGLT